MVRWRDTDGAIEHNFSAKLLSHHRHRVIAPSPSLCRTIPSSSSHHRVIAPSTQTRWCDGTIVNCVAVTRFWYYELMSQGEKSNNGATFSPPIICIPCINNGTTPPPPDCDRLNVHKVFGQKIYIRRSQSYQTQSICLVVWVFWSHSRIFHLYGDLNVTGEGFQFDLHTTVTPDTERLAVEQSLFCQCVRRKYNPAHTNTMLCIYWVLH